ncbi:CubicO group peptidase, beta-lactamase class C family [Asanoa hainanensis]|uniref:CubicO group peptidase, beta-lactamase class C family n=1 Tax=Asanoa hainanensis TaxID=560556 RepID=A0A239PEU7_9ACTN|nr:serine hydrolase domain-containing protein [Asanoa hainanensis]SNT65616.1 CubicO group peptidase, beta-lactamase class C family [Asanoa hainanensis]
MRFGRTIVAVVGLAALVATPASAVLAPPDAPGPPTVTSADIRFARPPLALRYGTAREAGLTPRYVDRIHDTIAAYLEPSPTHPMYPGAVALAGRGGVIVAHDAVGFALRYADAKPTELPRDRWIPMRRDTIFDVASMTKLFTAIAAVQLVESGRLSLDARVVRYLPAFAAHGKSDITIRNLLTHTSGLPADPDASLCAYDTDAERWAAVLGIKPANPPNTVFLYADTNMMVLGKVIETITRQRLDRVVAERITGPLRMRETMFNPPARLRSRIAAEEYQPGRGIVWGSVHDENAYCLGGVSGHAGVFATARDLATLAQALLNGGRYGDARILSERSTRSLFTDYNGAFPTHAHGLGFELDQRRYMGALSSPVTAGHTGFTGTSIVIDPLAHSFAILLTNRVHPTREWGNNNPSRAAVGTDLALALPVRPTQGTTAWFTGTADDTTATLTIPARVPREGARASFDLWYDTAPPDAGALEASKDGGRTWRLVPSLLRAPGYRWSTDGTSAGFQGRRWLTAVAPLPAGTTHLRWRSTTAAAPHGRGIYVDAVRVVAPSGTIFDDRRPADAARFRATGWTPSRD